MFHVYLRFVTRQPASHQLMTTWGRAKCWAPLHSSTSFFSHGSSRNFCRHFPGDVISFWRHQQHQERTQIIPEASRSFSGVLKLHTCTPRGRTWCCHHHCHFTTLQRELNLHSTTSQLPTTQQVHCKQQLQDLISNLEHKSPIVCFPVACTLSLPLPPPPPHPTPTVSLIQLVQH